MAGSSPVRTMVPGGRPGLTDPAHDPQRTPRMTTLLVVGLVSGLVTAVSPCVLPVLPVVLTTSAGREAAPWRPVAVVGGMVLAFGAATLLGAAVLGALGLPQDVLRWAGITVLTVVGLGLLWPRLGHLVEAPFARIRPLRMDRDGNPFVLGLGMGLVFVPCAGPVLASITVLAATEQIGPELVALTAAYCLGVALPLLGIALAGDRILARVRAVRERTRAARTAAGAVMVATALVIATGAAEPLQRATPEWLQAISEWASSDADVQAELRRLGDEAPSAQALTFAECADADPGELRDCGPAPELVGLTGWLNSEPVDLAALRGRVVLVDFWTYSCINCQRTLPYLTRWADEYADDGLVVIGVHAPEFAFEREARNVADAAERFGIRYPIALDNDFVSWRAYDQRFWPAKYLIDPEGTVRQVHYGEGAYAETEAAIRELLGLSGEVRTDGDPRHTDGRTPETYLGSDRVARLQDDEVVPGLEAEYELQEPDLDSFSLGGTWRVEPEYAQAGQDAVLGLTFRAAQVHLVLEGEGTVTVTVDGQADATRVVEVSGTPQLHTLYDGAARTAVLRLAFTPGVRAYAFTFG